MWSYHFVSPFKFIRRYLVKSNICPLRFFFRVFSESKQLKKQLLQMEEASLPLPLAHPLLTIGDVPPPPSNSFQLEVELRKIGSQPEAVYRYLRVSKPETRLFYVDSTSCCQF